MLSVGKEEFLLQLLADYILLNEISAGTINEAFLYKVGIKFGLRLEDSYRAQYGLQGQFTPAHFAGLAEEFISSLGGKASILVCTHSKVVIKCHACIFGLMVIKAPGLCRISSAIFGGIAARNFGYCKVAEDTVDEALCRKVFHLRESEAAAAKGMVFTDNPASYLLTSEELQSLGEKIMEGSAPYSKFKESFKNLELMHREMETEYNLLREQMFSDLGFGILIINEKRHVSYMNEAARKLLRVEGGKNVFNFSVFQKLLEDTFTSGKRYTHHELALPFADGTKYYLLNTSPLTAEDGSLSGAVSVLQDISEHKYLENEMLQMEKYSLVAELAAGTAHEIRNPITTIRGFLQVLATEFKQGSREENICALMIEEIDRANTIIKEFLLLTKPAAPDLKKVDLYLVLDDIFLLIESKSLLENVNLERGYFTSLPTVKIDQDQIKQVFLNLATNSIQSMPGGGKLTISAYAQDGRVYVVFTDTGCGIHSEEVKRIFDPFYTTKEHGTGLGLSISYRIIEAHGGRISVDSTPGAGSVFIVELPVCETEQ